jgi:hypothetical protein
MNVGDIVDQEMKNDMVVAWNELEEALTSLKTLSPEEQEECKDAIVNRIDYAFQMLGKYVQDDDIIEML